MWTSDYEYFCTNLKECSFKTTIEELVIDTSKWYRTEDGIFNGNNGSEDVKDNLLECVRKTDIVRCSGFDNDYRFMRQYFEVCKVEAFDLDDERFVEIQDEYGNSIEDYIDEIWIKVDNNNMKRVWSKEVWLRQMKYRKDMI